MKHLYYRLWNKIPYVKKLHKEINFYKSKMYFLPGHFYSPIVSWNDVKNKENLWDYSNRIEGINLNLDDQKQLVNRFLKYYNDIPWPSEKKDNLRFYFQNDYYSYTDGIFLYSMIRDFRPQRIIEIGSGFSSALMLDTNELFFNNTIKLTFIEPFPERLYSLIGKSSLPNVSVFIKKVEEISLLEFEKLEKGDFLFVDSSHVSKTGSDVNHIIFNILPRLKKGVIIHFHDVFYPFEYPKLWVYQGRNWNEIYLLRGFLMNNDKYKIRLFSNFLHQNDSSIFESMPLCMENRGGSLWIEKI